MRVQGLTRARCGHDAAPPPPSPLARVIVRISTKYKGATLARSMSFSPTIEREIARRDFSNRFVGLFLSHETGRLQLGVGLFGYTLDRKAPSSKGGGW